MRVDAELELAVQVDQVGRYGEAAAGGGVQARPPVGIEARIVGGDDGAVVTPAGQMHIGRRQLHRDAGRVGRGDHHAARQDQAAPDRQVEVALENEQVAGVQGDAVETACCDLVGAEDAVAEDQTLVGLTGGLVREATARIVLHQGDVAQGLGGLWDHADDPARRVGIGRRLDGRAVGIEQARRVDVIGVADNIELERAARRARSAGQGARLAVQVDARGRVEADQAAVAGVLHRPLDRLAVGLVDDIEVRGGAGGVQHRTWPHHHEGVAGQAPGDHAIRRRGRRPGPAKADRAAVLDLAEDAAADVGGGEGLARDVQRRAVADPDRAGQGEVAVAAAVDAALQAGHGDRAAVGGDVAENGRLAVGVERHRLARVDREAGARPDREVLEAAQRQIRPGPPRHEVVDRIGRVGRRQPQRGGLAGVAAGGRDEAGGAELIDRDHGRDGRTVRHLHAGVAGNGVVREAGLEQARRQGQRRIDGHGLREHRARGHDEARRQGDRRRQHVAGTVGGEQVGRRQREAVREHRRGDDRPDRRRRHVGDDRAGRDRRVGGVVRLPAHGDGHAGGHGPVRRRLDERAGRSRRQRVLQGRVERQERLGCHVVDGHHATGGDGHRLGQSHAGPGHGPGRQDVAGDRGVLADHHGLAGAQGQRATAVEPVAADGPIDDQGLGQIGRNIGWPPAASNSRRRPG